jgi:uncharacterized repeat protein (TIGR01451 family)
MTNCRKWQWPVLGLFGLLVSILFLVIFPTVLFGEPSATALYQQTASDQISVAHQQSAAPQSMWSFECAARRWEGVFPGAAGVNFRLYGSNSATPGSGTLLTQGITGTSGTLTLSTQTYYPYFHIGYTLPTGFNWYSHDCGEGASHCPCNVAGMQPWMSWQQCEPGTFYSNVYVTTGTPSPTPTATIAAFATLSGRVYEGITGLEPPLSTPIQSVRVDLFCSNEDYPDLGAVIDTKYTNDQGWYGLDVAVRNCKYYYIKPTNLPGYTSDGASSVGGVVMTPDLIQYAAPLWDKTLTGNKFWDRRPGTPTPTGTPTPRATSTSTRTPTLGPSPTATNTRPPGGSADLQLSKTVVAPPSGPVKPGDKVQFNLVVLQNGPAAAANVAITDTLPAGMTFDMASGPCTLTKPTQPQQVRCNLGDLPPAPTGTIIWLQATVDQGVCGPLVNRAEVTSGSPDPDSSNNAASATVHAGACPELPVRLSKTLTDPPGGVAAVGAVVAFEVRATNPGAAPATVDVEDIFRDAEFDSVSAVPMPAMNGSDGTHHVLVWKNVTIPAGGAVILQVRLRTKIPGAAATNCAHHIPAAVAGGAAATGPLSCASVRVRALEGRHASIYKKFTVPGNHVAQLGDWLSFETQWLNVGTETAGEVRLHDYMAPPPVSSFLPLDFGFLWPFSTGDWAKTTAAFKSEAVASPAINTAEWTATWPDGTKTTQSAADYVYIVDGQIAKGLFLTKRMMDPLPSAAVSDTITFHIGITNATGVDIPALSLLDSFPFQCLVFTGATIPQDSVTPGKIGWNNIGPLPQGATVGLDIFFHAAAVCPAALNCAVTGYQSPGGQTMYAAGCDTVPILGERPQLAVRKTRTSPSPAAVGDAVVWQIEVENIGPAPLSVVPLHDGYQVAYFDFLSATPAPNTVDLIHGRLDWNNLGPLGPGGKHTVTLRLAAKAPGLGATNCAESYYSVGSNTFRPSDCATVDIRSEPPSIEVQKQRVAQDPDRPVAVGDTVTFKITASNTGPTPLADVVVLDHYDADCLEFVNAPGMTTIYAPGFLRWEFPGPSALGPGASLSWEVVFRVKGPCNPVGNCVAADGKGPQGQPVHHEACVEIGVVPREPGLRVIKRLVQPQGAPVLGDVMAFEVVVQNAGNTALAVVAGDDNWDPGCLEFAGAIPVPDSVAAAQGRAHWDDVGPLGPGDSAVLSVFLRVKAACQVIWNCGRAFWLVNDTPELDAADCVELPIRPQGHRIYLPVIMKWQ